MLVRCGNVGTSSCSYLVPASDFFGSRYLE